MKEIPINIDERIQWAVDFAWQICLNKIQYQEIKINKEASLQLQYANILRSVLELVKFSKVERVDIELETSYFINKKHIIVDIIIAYENEEMNKKHSIELKFYRTKASSGGKRGANDIFMYSVYKDLYYSELYLENEIDYATCLVLTDYENFINPKNKKTKNWVYDISNNHLSQAKIYDTSIGGKQVNFELKNNYLFSWTKIGDFWGCILRDNNRGMIKFK